jgi:hypothetical protein
MGHTALQTIYTGGILPLHLYGDPVWENAIYKANHKAKLTRVQRLKRQSSKSIQTVWQRKGEWVVCVLIVYLVEKDSERITEP